jgi:hypothetical protein
LSGCRGCTTGYRLGKNDKSEVVEDFDEIGKLGQGFASIDELEEVDLGEVFEDQCTSILI